MIGLRLSSSVLLSAVSGVLVLSSFGCDSTPPRGPCNRAGAPPGCNAECSELAPCATGLYCNGSNRCTADCSDEVACRSGQTCGSDGRCGTGMMDAGRDAPPIDAPGTDFGPPRDVMLADMACASVRLETNRSTPNVVLIIDQSGSMGMEQFPPGSGVTRWTALRDSLIGPGAGPGGFLDGLDSNVRFGLVTYREQTAIPGCPDRRAVPALLDNYSTLRGVYTTLTPGGATPTGDAIAATLASLSEIVTVPDEPTIFVLATDGEPNTCEDTMDTAGGRLESVAAIQSAFTAGIRTFVISVGSEIATTHLQELANAGIGATPSDPPAMFWVATETASLAAALDSIVGSVASCSIELMGRIDVTQACLGTVTLDGRELPCNGVDGWRAVDPTHIELQGAACDELQSAGGVLDAIFPCDVIVF